MLFLLLADALLAACSGGATPRRTREDASLLLIAGGYQLTGELPAAASASAPRLARLAVLAGETQAPTTPSEVWSLFEHYARLREQYEREARAQGLSEEVIQKGLAEIDAKMKALADKANALEDRRSRRGSTVWKRFFDGLGRFMGRAFDIGGKIVKFALEDVPAGVGEYGPEVVKALAQEYVKKLRGELREKGEQKAFEILAEKSPNLAGAYLLFKAGRAGVKALRDFARLFGRHRRGGQATAPAVPEVAGEDDAGEGEFALPNSGTWSGTCNLGRDDSLESWCEMNAGQLTHEPAYTLTIDFGAGTFSLTGKSECLGPKFTNSSSGWTQITTSEELQGGGTLHPDGWLVGMVQATSVWIERGVWVRASGSESYEDGGPTTGTVPFVAYIGTDEDLVAVNAFFTHATSGEADALDPDWLRSLGWAGVVDWLGVCEACYVVCSPGGGP
jgi:hypothetical protein